MHHIVHDGHSHGVVRNELATIYRAFLEGKPHSLPELQIGYKEYAQWQHTQDFNDLVKSQETYWLTQLRGS